MDELKTISQKRLEELIRCKTMIEMIKQSIAEMSAYYSPDEILEDIKMTLKAGE